MGDVIASLRLLDEGKERFLVDGMKRYRGAQQGNNEHQASQNRPIQARSDIAEQRYINLGLLGDTSCTPSALIILKRDTFDAFYFSPFSSTENLTLQSPTARSI